MESMMRLKMIRGGLAEAYSFVGDVNGLAYTLAWMHDHRQPLAPQKEATLLQFAMAHNAKSMAQALERLGTSQVEPKAPK